MHFIKHNNIVKNHRFVIIMPGFVLFILVLCLGSNLQAQVVRSDNPPKPNILIIMADDLGFSDIGSYGSEINTPHLDKLAENGLRMTRFYNTARCSPSRASLLTGLYPHQAGVSLLDSDYGVPGYRGSLADHSVTLAEVLREVGYNSYLSGKWHVGKEEGHWPLDRGFERYYGLIEGSSNFYDNTDFRNPERHRLFLIDREPYQVPVPTEEMWRNNEGYHMTDAFTDYAIEFLDEHDSSNPFFLYLAYTAPHWPLHAFPKDIKTYQGTYEMGWDSLRAQRYQKQIELGITDPDTELAPTSDRVEDWDQADSQRKEQWKLEMAIYAAMIDHMDRNIGRVIDKLKAMGEFKNTLILFLSDNGGSHTTPTVSHLDGEPGGPRSFPSYGYEGAEVSNVPFRLWKQFTHEGGIASPLIAHYPKLIEPGKINGQVSHIIDIVPTIVELTGAIYPDQRNGTPIRPMQGESMLPVFRGGELPAREPIYFEHSGNRGVRDGQWKLVSSRFDLVWELYNVEDDPTELNDVSGEHPEIKNRMIGLYEIWAEENNVLSYPELEELRQNR